MSDIRDYINIVESFNENWNPFRREKKNAIPNPAVDKPAQMDQMSTDDELKFQQIREYFKTNGVNKDDPIANEYLADLNVLEQKYADTPIGRPLTRYLWQFA